MSADLLTFGPNHLPTYLMMTDLRQVIQSVFSFLFIIIMEKLL